MSEDSSEFKPLPRRRRKSSGGENKPRKRQAVGAGTPSVPRRTSRRRAIPAEDVTDAPRPARRRRAARKNSFGWFKYVALMAFVGVGGYILLNLQPAPSVVPSDITPEPNATLVPTSAPFFPIIPLPQILPTAAPTLTPTPSIPEIAIVAGHWAPEATDGVPVVRDSGAVCPDGLREVEITKSVADKTLAMMERRGYRTILLQEFDPLYESEPRFKPRVFLSIHADSCLTGADYSYATGYKIAHAQPSDNESEDNRLVTCLTRNFDQVAVKYDKPFNANTITRNMTEYHAFRKIDSTTPAAIIELGFLGWDRDFLTNRQDEMARGLAIGLEEFLKGKTCLPATATPEPTETVLP